MSVYSSGVEAYRDTTKWLTALLPLAALASSAGALGPGLVTSLRTSGGITAWAGTNTAVLGCLVLIIAAVAVILWRAAVVLSVEPLDLGTIANDKASSDALTTAIGAGITLPYFWDRNSFDAEMGSLDLELAKQPPSTLPADLRYVRLTAAVPLIQEWSVHHRTRRPFRIFLGAFVGGLAVIVGALTVAVTQLGGAAAINEPTPVLVAVESAGAAELRAATGCTSPQSSTFVAVGGSWDRPWLAVDGPGCRFGAVWIPAAQLIELRPAPAAER